ncbi:MAG: site-specific integrase [Lachnospiraceae bacterium]|nr:site-specific integrase [Lachnospiraceae bacterium]
MAERGRKKKIPGITYQKNGYVLARFTRLNGERVQKHFSDLNEAVKWLENKKYEDRHRYDPTSKVITPSNITFDQLFEEWMQDKIILERAAKYNTIRLYRERYERRIKPLIGDTKVCEILPWHVEKVWRNAREKDDANDSMSKIKYIMNSVLKEARRKRLIAENPMDDLELKCPPRRTKERRVLSQSEQDKFEEGGKFSSHYDEFIFALHTGVRCGELSALKWTDINWKERTFQVTGTLYFDENEKCFKENSPKTTKGYRTIYLDDAAYKVLCRKRDERKIIPIKQGHSNGFEKYVFLNEEGLPTRGQVYNRSLTAIAKRIGIDNLTMHCLRHTFATRCIEKNMNPKTLQIILGHSDIMLTMNLYVHPTDEQIISEMKKLAMN